MAGTKTGNKGFINPADGDKVYVMDPVPPGDPGANGNPPAYDPGEMSVDNRVKDISAKTRITLGTYLSKVTKGEAGAATKPNTYTVDPSTDTSLPQPITTNGYPTPLGPSQNSSQFKPILPSSFSADYSAVSDKIKKGRGPSPVPDGNSLLPDATANATSTQLKPGPVKDYTDASTGQNRWTLAGQGFSGGADISAPPRDFNVPLQSEATAVMPSGEATDPSIAKYELDLQTAARTAEAVTENNEFPIVVGSSVTLTSTTTADGQHPAPLTPVVDGAYAPYLRNSYSAEDYGNLKVGAPDGLQKGKSPAEGPTGHTFLIGAEVAGGTLTAPRPLVDYTAAATEPNRWTPSGPGFTGGDDPSSPPREFNVPLQSEATAVLPADEAIDPSNAKYELDLATAAARAAQLTAESTSFYTLSPPDTTSLASTTDELGYPAPLTPVANANAEFHAAEILPGASPAYAAVADLINKGKSLDAGIDGNTLLGSSIKQFGNVAVLPEPLKIYTNRVTEQNYSTSDSRFVPPELDPTAPPSNYEAPLRRVEEKGKNSGAGVPSSILTSGALRKIPSQETARNSYPVDPTLYALDSTTDENGDPLRLVDSKNDSRFVENKSEIRPLSSDASMKNFSKGKGDGAYDGHTLLKSVGGNSDVKSDKTVFTTPVKDSTPEQHPVYQYEGDRGGTTVGPSAIGRSRFLSVQAPAAGFDPTLTLADGTRVSTLKLAKVGTGLGLRASAEIPAWYSSDFDPTGEISELGAVLPSVAQLGILKVNNQLLSAKDVLDSIESADDVPTGALAEIAPFGGQSWGSMSNASEQFDDPGSSIGMFLTLLAIMIALTLLYSLISLLTSPGERVKTNAEGQYTLGSYKFKEPSNSLFTFPDVSEIFGIKPTINSYEDALLAGFSSFFLGATNLDTSALGIALKLGAAALSAGADTIVGDNSVLGANVVVCRSIVRSGLVFAEYISGLVRKFQLSIVGGIKAVLGILRVFRSSKFIASLNVFSALGDQLLNAKLTVPQILGADGKPQSVGASDRQPADLVKHSTVRKNRLTSVLGYDPTLSWASKRAPSSYLVPSNVQNLVLSDTQNLLGSFKGPSMLEQDKNKIKERNYYYSAGTRISTEERAKLERILDAEYVPFYFHDIRTNEIISFHAFLASLGDSYSAAYDSVEGFGRVEPIRTYKNTTRKIDMSFYVASTSPEDFDHMWHKINKLTTLIYPQYTKGKLTTTEAGASYRSPFSQLVGASPLIRIRLGDLFRSNYSRFALARLFGAADGDTKLPDKFGKITEVVDVKGTEQERIENFFKRIKNLQPGDVVTIKNRPDFGEYKIASYNSAKGTYTLVNVQKDDINATLASTFPYSLDQINLTPSDLARIQKEEGAGVDSPLNDFMSPEQNSIVKSFESAGGKGLAGFIENMSFDWYDKVTWEIDPYRTAPKMCKVTVSFAPIHDITPGIDHLGYNRAPIYPVGYAMATSEPEAKRQKFEPSDI